MRQVREASRPDREGLEADAFTLTPFVTESSDCDGVPAVLAGAMACGLPVVSITVAGIPESVTQDDSGALPHDVEAVAGALAAAALAALLTDAPRRRRPGAAARRPAAEGFDPGANARQIAAIFERTLAPWA